MFTLPFLPHQTHWDFTLDYSRVLLCPEKENTAVSLHGCLLDLHSWLVITMPMRCSLLWRMITRPEFGQAKESTSSEQQSLAWFACAALAAAAAAAALCQSIAWSVCGLSIDSYMKEKHAGQARAGNGICDVAAHATSRICEKGRSSHACWQTGAACHQPGWSTVDSVVVQYY